ncbi:hypothetical protein F4680DRAFT_434854, partial [Xylaria scruposa]
MVDKKSSKELNLIRPDEGLQPTIRIINYSFDINPDYLHRTFYTCCLTIQNLSSLPLLNRVTQLRLFPAPNCVSESEMDFVHMRPISMRVSLELASHLPYGDDMDQAAQMLDLVSALSLSSLSTILEFEDI